MWRVMDATGKPPPLAINVMGRVLHREETYTVYWNGDGRSAAAAAGACQAINKRTNN